MFVAFNFELLRLRYIKGAMDAIASFRPDGKTPADVAAMIADATSPTGPRGAHMAANATLQLAQGEYDEDISQGHDVCVQVYAILKSRFRTDPGSLSAINALPVTDQSAADTFSRLKAISILWDKLLDVGSWAGARDKGWIRSEGKEYVVQDGDVMEFRHG